MSETTVILENEENAPVETAEIVNLETPVETAGTAAPEAALEEIPAAVETPNKKYTNSGVADIVFLVDVTGSMQPCIDALRNNINTFIDMLTSTEGNGSPVSDWRARVVGYRDYTADSPTSYGWLNDNVFTRDVTVLRNQLASLVARGGGDVPESLLDAMMTVAQTGSIDLQSTGDDENSNKWRAPGTAARIVIVFTDATYHPTMSIPGYEGAGPKDLRNVYYQERIKPYYFVPEDPSYVILGRFQGAILTQCGGGSNGLLDVTSDQSRFQKLLEQLAMGVSKSASVPVRL